MQASYLEEIKRSPHGFTLGEGVVIISPSDRSVGDRQRSVEGIRQGRINTALFRDAVLHFTEVPKAYAVVWSFSFIPYKGHSA